jgi:hypothetical protein
MLLLEKESICKGLDCNYLHLAVVRRCLNLGNRFLHISEKDKQKEIKTK